MPDGEPASVAQPSSPTQLLSPKAFLREDRKCISCKQYMRLVEDHGDYGLFACECTPTKLIKIYRHGDEKIEPVSEFLGITHQLLSRSDKNPPYYNKSDFQLLLSLPEKNAESARAREVELLSQYEKIAGRYKNTFKMLSYFYMVGCSFALDVEKNLDVDLQAIYRIMEKLVKAGFIEPVTKTRIPRKSGRKTTLYGVLDVTKKEIDEAISREMRFSSKSFKFVDQLYQRTLCEIEREAIQYSKIVNLARKQGNSGFMFMDIAKQVAKIHHTKGIAVLNYNG